MSDDYSKLVRELRGLVRDEVQKALGPTGVSPGVYSSVTVGTDGRVRFGTAGVSSMTLKAIAQGGTVVNRVFVTGGGGTEYPTRFGTVLYDPGSAITLVGTTDWYYTAPTAGYYFVSAGIQTRSQSWVDGDDVYFYVSPSNGVGPATWADYNAFPSSGTVTADIYLNAAATTYLGAGSKLRLYFGVQVTNSGSVRWDGSWINIYQC